MNDNAAALSEDTRTDVREMTDEALSQRREQCNDELGRLKGTLTVDAVEQHVRRWVARYQTNLSTLTLDELDALGVRMLFSVPAIAQQVEAVLLEHMTANLPRAEQAQKRIDELTAEHAALVEEELRRYPPVHRATGPYGTSLSGGTISAVSGTKAVAALQFRRDGLVFQEINGVLTQLAPSTDWIRPSYGLRKTRRWSIRATLIDGDRPNGSLDTWHNMSPMAAWELVQSGPGSKRAELSIALSYNGGATVAVSKSYELVAEVPA